MEREANYAAVGAFVVLVVVMAVLFVYWYSDAREHRDYTRFEVYFEGSVSGLERGAPVRYLGVDIGRVYSMRIDPRDSSRVQVLVDLTRPRPYRTRRSPSFRSRALPACCTWTSSRTPAPAASRGRCRARNIR